MGWWLMRNSRSTGCAKGFVFSFDAVIAAMILATAFYILAVPEQQNTNLSSFTLSGQANSAFTSLEESGYITRTLDTNSPSQSLQLLEQELSSLLPDGTGVSM